MTTPKYPEYYIHLGDKWEPNEDKMLLKLLQDGVLFVNDRRYLHDHKDEVGGRTTVLFVNANDTFAWGVADAEDLPLEELPHLLELHLDNPKCGATQWLCLRRNLQPQAPVIEWLKKYNGWNDKLAGLPANP